MTDRLPTFADFATLTGHDKPFPWQEAMYNRLTSVKDLPTRCRLPTGMGKTSLIALWLLALAAEDSEQDASPTADRPRLPRRLAYVVNRRTVVDQATTEALHLRKKLMEKDSLSHVRQRLQSLGAHESELPFAISSLRGQVADNREWCDDLARPAVVIGTVDMIGSRLLFSGYRLGYRSKPTHAGVLGRDTLLIHDEAHLEPAFQELIERIHQVQNDEDQRRLRVMELTATSRSSGEVISEDAADDTTTFRLGPKDQTHPVARQRLEATKRLKFHVVPDAKAVREGVTQQALEYADSGSAVLIYLRGVEDVEQVATALGKAKAQVARLTGTMRGLERDVLTGLRDSEQQGLHEAAQIFARFLPERDRRVEPMSGTVFLVCTAAGEVGVNLSADHLVCDLTPYDSMAQRFGRVNRFGNGAANLHVIHEEKFTAKSEYEQQREKTAGLLRELTEQDGTYDASPSGLEQLSDEKCAAAFTPQPTILHASDVLFDAWSLTTIPGEHPGRPQVAPWLHGVVENEIPQTTVAWREEVWRMAKASEGLRETEHPPQELLKAFPLKSHETLSDRYDRVFKSLAKLAKEHPSEHAWLIEDDRTVDVLTLAELVERGKDALRHKTLILSARAGGLEGGMFTGKPAKDDQQMKYDVADEWLTDSGDKRRRRVQSGEEEAKKDLSRYQLVRRIDFGPDDEDDESDEENFWKWYVLPASAEDGSGSYRTAGEQQLLHDHHDRAEQAALTITARVGLSGPEREAVVLAAKFHDLGKARTLWQHGIGNHDYQPGNPETTWAKSGTSRRPLNHHYRHELGSLLDLVTRPEFAAASEEVRELALHLIAAHHGRARPAFPANETFDPERTTAAVEDLAPTVPRRFGDLQRRYGRWRLAWLESLVRAADAAASRDDVTIKTVDSPPMEPAPNVSAAPVTVGAPLTIAVNEANPGEFFACCGLLEVAARLHSGAEGWFAPEGGAFHVAAPGVESETLADEMLRVLSELPINNTMTPDELARLDVLTQKKSKEFTAAEKVEKKGLDSKWRSEALVLGPPIGLRLDWFLDEWAGGKRFKTWAGMQSVIDIAQNMQNEVRGGHFDEVPPVEWLGRVHGSSVSFNLNADQGVQASALDVGFSLDPLGMSSGNRPIVEWAAFVGLQRFRPTADVKANRQRYHAWCTPLPANAAAAAVAGQAPPHILRAYEFPLLYRTQYLKSFLPASLSGANR